MRRKILFSSCFLEIIPHWKSWVSFWSRIRGAGLCWHNCLFIQLNQTFVVCYLEVEVFIYCSTFWDLKIKWLNLVFFRWCHIFRSAVRLRSEDVRWSVVHKRGSLPDYQQHVSAFAFDSDRTPAACICECVLAVCLIPHCIQVRY